MKTALISSFVSLVLFVSMSPCCGVTLILGTLRYMQMFFLLRRCLINGGTIVAVQSRSCFLAGRDFLFQLAFILFVFTDVFEKRLHIDVEND